MSNMSEGTPNRLKPKSSLPLNPSFLQSSMNGGHPSTSINSASMSLLPNTISTEKFSPPASPRDSDTSRKFYEGDMMRKKSLPEIRSPHNPNASNAISSPPQGNIGNSNNGAGNQMGRGHRRSLGSRGSFDHTTAPTSFDSNENSFLLDDIAVPIGTGISLSSKQVRHLFPYHIAVNYDFQITQMGNALVNFLKQKTLIKTPTTDHIGKYFRIVSTSTTANVSWDWYQLSAAQNHSLSSLIASITSNATSTSSSSSSSFISHALHQSASQSQSNQSKELTIELELSKDFLLQETSAPIRLVGTLHRIHPKDDPEALCFSAFFFLNPKIQTQEEMKMWQLNTSDVSQNSLQAENIQLLEEKRQNSDLIAQQQQTIQKLEREIQALKQNQSENAVAAGVRQLIGNVTHDLKTPLGGFLTGVESIKDYVQELSLALDVIKQSSHSPLKALPSAKFPLSPQKSGFFEKTPSQLPIDEPSNDLKRGPSMTSLREQVAGDSEFISSMEEKIDLIRSKIKDISDINNFMTMTINRCIDYAKVGQNLKLKPKLETVDLFESLYLPLNCMKSLQTRIAIALDPVDDNICSTVITDKQWLQENLLCLLSNAVKYSHEGEVTVRMFVHPAAGAANQTKDNSSMMKYITRLTDKQRQQFSLPRTNRHSFHLGSVTNSVSTSPNLVPQRMRTRSLTNEDYSGGRSPRSGSNTPRTAARHSQHPSLDLSGRLKVSDLNDINPSLAPSPTPSVSQSLPAPSSMLQHLPPSGRTSPPRSNVVMTNKGPLTLDIPQLDYELSTSQFIVIEVEDRGTGINEEVRESLFSPFQQAQRLAGGTGLGLFSLAKRLEALHGYYGVDARRDGERGSLFWFAIPYRPDEESSKFHPSSKVKYTELTNQLNNALNSHANIRTPVAAYQPISPVPKLSRLETMKTQRLIDVTSHIAAASTNTPRHQLNILVVDDSVPILKTVRHSLLRKGYDVETSHNGLDCLDKVQQRLTSFNSPYDVILMDLNMPVLDGLEATRRIRQQEEENYKKDGVRHVIIGVSANSDEDTILDALSAGIDDFICKPFSMDTFNATLQKLKLI